MCLKKLTEIFDNPLKRGNSVIYLWQPSGEPLNYNMHIYPTHVHCKLIMEENKNSVK